MNANTRWIQCFLTIPAIIYLTMTPRFDRSRRFAIPSALLTVDAIYTLLWLSAFSAQASFNSSGKCKGGCGLSKAIVGLGVFIWYDWPAAPIFSFSTPQSADKS
jgi:hypothetical protein